MKNEIDMSMLALHLCARCLLLSLCQPVHIANGSVGGRLMIVAHNCAIYHAVPSIHTVVCSRRATVVIVVTVIIINMPRSTVN